MNYIEATLEGPRTRAAGARKPWRFVAGSEGVKRDGVSLNMRGAILSRFQPHGAVLWAHEFARPPIGRATMAVDQGRMLADVELDLGDPFAADVDRKIEAGFIRSCSLGFGILERRGTDAVRWEVLELSIVPIGLDADATVQRSLHLTPQEAFITAAVDRLRQEQAARSARLAGLRLDLNRAALLADLDALQGQLRRAR